VNTSNVSYLCTRASFSSQKEGEFSKHICKSKCFARNELRENGVEFKRYF